MAKQKIKGLSATLLEPATAPSADSSAVGETRVERPIVQTVKVPPDVYLRLKTLGARERRSSQDIILAALRDYLDRSSEHAAN